MLKHSTYQAARVFSQEGMCWTMATTITSSGGSRRIAGTRKTFVAWYDWLRGVFTSSTCASAAPAASRKNAVQTLMPWCSLLSRAAKGRAATHATPVIITRYAVADSESRFLPPPELGPEPSPKDSSVGTALTAASRLLARTALSASPSPFQEPQKEGGSVSQGRGGTVARHPPSE